MKRGVKSITKWYKNERSNKAIEFKESEAFSQLGRTWWKGKSGFSCRGILYNSSYLLARSVHRQLETWAAKAGGGSTAGKGLTGCSFCTWKGLWLQALGWVKQLVHRPKDRTGHLRSLLKTPNALSFVTLIWNLIWTDMKFFIISVGLSVAREAITKHHRLGWL